MSNISDKEYSDSMAYLHECLKNGYIKSSDIISLAERDLKCGEIDASMYAYTVRYFTLIDRLQRTNDKYIDLNELVDNGIFESIDEIQDIMNANKSEFSGKIFSRLPCEYPEPTDEEKSQYVDSEDISRVCVVCFIRRRHTIMMPCSHNVLCSVCSKTIVEQMEGDVKCPICCMKVEKIHRVYN